MRCMPLVVQQEHFQTIQRTLLVFPVCFEEEEEEKEEKIEVELDESKANLKTKKQENLQMQPAPQHRSTPKLSSSCEFSYLRTSY